MIRKELFALLMMSAVTYTALAFSPYENNLMTSKIKRTALIASVKPGQETATDVALMALLDKKTIKALKKVHISNLSCYKKELNGKIWVMIYFDFEGDDYLKAASNFESASEAIKSLNKSIVPHPRAKHYGTTWLQMEWINYIRGSQSEEETKNSFSMVTTIKPEKEMEYRLLHQSVWPGVVDQMARGNNRHFSIFLVEINKTIYEFFYLEYVGTDPKKDEEMNRTDPTNLRWWKLTDACQTPLQGTKDIWSMMDKVIVKETK